MYTGCVRVFLALVTAQGFESIHISKWNPGCRTRPLVAAEVLVSASPSRYSQWFYNLLLILQFSSSSGSETLDDKEPHKQMQLR